MNQSLQLVSLVVLLFGVISRVNAFWRVQSVAVRGKAMCGNKPLANVQIKLVDEDDGPDPDDVMDNGWTKEDGSFYMSGTEREITNIDPVLKIYHNCNDHGLPCQRKWAIGIPDKYISSGSETNKVFDLGVVNAEIELDGEERDCIH